MTDSGGNGYLRRGFLRWASSGAAAAAMYRPSRKAISDTGHTLRRIAEERGLLYGSCCVQREVASDRGYAELLAAQCGVIVPGIELKWAALRRSPSSFDFSGADVLQAFASSIKAKFRGHTLVWHEAMPEWLVHVSDRHQVRQLLHAHIRQVCGRYRGQMHSWDVVNEAIEPDDGRTDGLRETFWLKHLGPRYIDEAFRLAAEIDPCAILTYNDYDLTFTRADSRKPAAVLRLLERMRWDGVPVHALGLQAHLDTQMRFRRREFAAFLDEVAALGLAIFVTELDVYDGQAAGTIPERDAAVAATIIDYLSIVLENPAAALVVTWGVTDRYTWLNDRPRRGVRRPVRALPYDASLMRKPAWDALASSMHNAPARQAATIRSCNH